MRPAIIETAPAICGHWGNDGQGIFSVVSIVFLAWFILSVQFLITIPWFTINVALTR